MKLVRIYILIMSGVVFVGTLPHVVGAMLTPKITTVYVMVKAPCKASSMDMKALAKQVARGKVLAMYQSNYEWKALFKLWDKESRWDYQANNPHSTAFGIAQMLRLPEDTSMYKQIELGLKYIAHRYGTPSQALAFHTRNGWY